MNQNGINSSEPTTGFAAAREQVLEKGAEVKDRIADKGAEVKDRIAEKGAEIAGKAGEVRDSLLDKTAELKDRAGEVKDSLLEKGADLKERIKEQGSELKERAGELKDRLLEKVPSKEQLAEKTDSTINKTGEALHQLADTIRDKAPAEGPMGDRFNQVANTLDTSGQYLANHGLNDIQSDLSGLIRKYPMQSMGAGLALGFLVGATLSTNRR